MPEELMDEMQSESHAACQSAGPSRRNDRGPRSAVRVARWKAAVLGVGALAMLALGSTARALDLTGGPSDTPPGGGGCTASGTLARDNGLTLNCTVTSPGNFVDLYFGLTNNTTPNGMAMDGSGPSGFEILRYSSATTNSIVYTSTTTIDDLGSTEDVNTRLVLTLTAGTGIVVDTGGTPANNDNGDIQKLFRIAGGSFSVHVDVDSNTLAIPTFGASNTNVYDPTHMPSNEGGGSITRVAFGFYYNECSP
jgi:hypothetical protein